jgi:hypothetical protein
LDRGQPKPALAEPSAIPPDTVRFPPSASRDPPIKPVSEAVFIIGRGGGKDSVATLIATNIAVNFDPRKLRAASHFYHERTAIAATSTWSSSA